MSAGEAAAAGAAAVTAAAPAGGGSSPRQPRRGPAPFASFDHDVSDESSPESKLTFQLPEIREDPTSPGVATLTVNESRARSHSTPAVHAGSSMTAAAVAAGLRAPNTPRIDISRASSSSHQDSRDSSPDMAFPSELAFREEGALDLRSSTEELAFLEGAPGGPVAPAEKPTTVQTSVTAPSSRRHSRKDSQSSETALLGVCGRSSRLSSVGSQGSALSALSRFSAMSRSPSPHRMMLETSFCGPRPIDNEPEICEKKLLEIARLSSERRESAPAPLAIPSTTPRAKQVAPDIVSNGCQIRTEATVEIPPQTHAVEKQHKEIKNKATAERRRVRSREAPPAQKQGNIIRIRLKPDSEYDDDDLDEVELVDISPAPSKPVTLDIRAATASPARTPSPNAGTPQRKSSFCSLFRASPESPASASRRKKSLTEGRPRSASRDRSSGLRGSVLSLFRTPRRSTASPPPPAATIVPSQPIRHVPHVPPPPNSEKLKYYEDTPTGIIHIPLRTPPDNAEPSTSSNAQHATPGPAPACVRAPLTRTVLPDGSIIIPLHSPTEKTFDTDTIEVMSSPVDSHVSSPPAASAASSPPQQHAATVVRATIETSRASEEVSKRSKQHVVFTTQVGGGGQVFSTQLSVTKTPSLSSELSAEIGSVEPVADSVVEPGEPLVAKPTAGPSVSRESPVPVCSEPESPQPCTSRDPYKPGEEPVPIDTMVHTGDSSESEASSDVTARRDGEETERRGLVLGGQESFEDDLPYVPTTLPLERSLAVPMVPVRERGGVHVAAVQRPRPPAPAPLSLPPPVSPPPAMPHEKLHIKLPGPHTPRSRVRSDWIDFEEVPERRKQPKRIQTLPTEGAADVVYVAPEHCRCECHHRSAHSPHSSTSLDCGNEECGEAGGAGGASGAGAAGSAPPVGAAAIVAAGSATQVELRLHIAQPFTADLDLRHEQNSTSPEERAARH